MGSYVDEFRGTDMLVYAEVLKDNNELNEGYVTGAVKILAPVAEISKTVETSTDTKYYDNKPALTIQGEGADTITLTIPALDLATLAEILGKKYDATTGAFMDGESKPKYFALGYRLRLTDGTYRYVWRYKGRFQPMDETSQTENAGTDSNNQTLTYTGISTLHIFTKPNQAQKALVVDERDDRANLTTFFNQVTTCDTLPQGQYVTLSLTVAADTEVEISDGEIATAYSAGTYTVTDFKVGDMIILTCTGGTMTVNGTSFSSGAQLTLNGNATIVSTKSV